MVGLPDLSIVAATPGGAVTAVRTKVVDQALEHAHGLVRSGHPASASATLTMLQTLLRDSDARQAARSHLGMAAWEPLLALVKEQIPGALSLAVEFAESGVPLEGASAQLAAAATQHLHSSPRDAFALLAAALNQYAEGELDIAEAFPIGISHVVQGAVQAYAAACAEGGANGLTASPAQLRPVALTPRSWKSGQPSRAAHTADTGLVYSALHAGPAADPADVIQVLLGLLRCTRLEAATFFNAGGLPVLLHAASQPVAESSAVERNNTPVQALAAIRTLLQLHAAPKRTVKVVARKEHLQRMHVPLHPTAQSAQDLSRHFAATDAVKVVINVALHHPDIWTRRAACECLECVAYRPVSWGRPGPGMLKPGTVRACPAAPVGCSAATWTSLLWGVAAWGSAGSGPCLALHPTDSEGGCYTPPASVDGEQKPAHSAAFLRSVLQSAGKADWLAEKWAKAGRAALQDERQDAV